MIFEVSLENSARTKPFALCKVVPQSPWDACKNGGEFFAADMAEDMFVLFGQHAARSHTLIHRPPVDAVNRH